MQKGFLLDLVTYNIKGNNPIKIKNILGQLKKMHCSIALLQETHLNKEEHQKSKREWVDQVYSSSYGKHKKEGLQYCSVNLSWVFSVKLHIKMQKVNMLWYAPNKDCPHYFKKLEHQRYAAHGWGLKLYTE